MGWFAIALGIAVLVGWVTCYRPLMTVLPGLVAMKPNTAVGLSPSGWSLLLFLQPAMPGSRSLARYSIALAASVALLGGLVHLQYAGHWNLGIDELLIRDHLARIAHGRMAPITAFNFICIGLALACLHYSKLIGWTHGFAACAAFTSLLAIVVISYCVAYLYQSDRFTAIALHTAVGFPTLQHRHLVRDERFWLHARSQR